IRLYPIMLLLIAVGLSMRSKIRDKKLFLISAIYFLAYYVSVSVVARWSNDIHSFERYLFPVGFFLFGILATIKPPPRSLQYAAAGIGAIYFILQLYLL